GSEQHLTRAAAAARTRTQRPGKHLAVRASELVVKPDFQILRRYRRPLLLRLEHTHRPTLEDYVHRATRLGSSRSLNMRIGIRANEQNQVWARRVALPPRRRGAIRYQRDAVTVAEKLLQPRYRAITRPKGRIHPSVPNPRSLQAVAGDQDLGGDPRCHILPGLATSTSKVQPSTVNMQRGVYHPSVAPTLSSCRAMSKRLRARRVIRQLAATGQRERLPQHRRAVARQWFAPNQKSGARRARSQPWL